MLLALLLAAAPADVPWLSSWMNTGSGKPGLMREWHDAFPASPHAQGALDFEAMERTRRVGETKEAAQLAGTAMAMLKSSKADLSTRSRAARVLGWLQWAAAIPVLRTAAEAGDAEAIDALGFFGEREKRSGALVFGGRPSFVTFAAHPDPAALEALMSAMKNGDAITKRIVTDQLTYFEGPKAAEAWHTAAANCASMDAMVWISKNDEAARVEMLEHCTTAEDVETRAVALFEIGSIGGRASIPRLLAALDAPEDLIFLSAHRALSAIEGHLGTAPDSAIADRKLLTALWRKKFADVK